MKRDRIIVLPLSLILFFVGCGYLDDIENAYEIHRTTKIEEYGQFPELDSIYQIQAYVKNIMPAQIEDIFVNPTYYFSYCEVPFMCEMYLEITIEDELQFQNYVFQTTKGQPTETFLYNENYQEYVLTDLLWLEPNKNGWLSKSEVQKVLFSEKNNKLIFISLIIPDADMPFSVFYKI